MNNIHDPSVWVCFHRDNISKILFQAPKPAEKSSIEVGSKSEPEAKERNGLSGEWEVLDGPEVDKHRSPSPEIIKKIPPTVKGKPRKGDSVKEKSGEGESKKVPMMPAEHLTSLASMLQKGPTKPNKVCFSILSKVWLLS